MKKLIILFAIFVVSLFVLPKFAEATILGNTGWFCIISDIDRGSQESSNRIDVVQAPSLADAVAINNLYLEIWKRSASCEELQKQLDWHTPLNKLRDWLNNQANSVIGDCHFPKGTTKDAVRNLNNIYLEEAGRNMNCNEALFHLRGTTHEALRNWLKTSSMTHDYQNWKNSFRLVEGTTYRDEDKFWLIKNGQRHWLPDIATLWAWGLIYGDSTSVPAPYIDAFRSMIPEGEQLKFWEGVYKVPVQNRFQGSQEGAIPQKLEEEISWYHNNTQTFRGWGELRSLGLSWSS